MAAVSSGIREGITIGSAVLVLAVGLAWRQRAERRGREGGLSEADQAYFAGKDRRRFLGTSLLVLIGVGMVVGCLIDARASRASRQAFVLVWSAVLGLVCVSVVLACLDWAANLRYAGRHRRELAAARLTMIEEELRLRGGGDGPSAAGRPPSLGPSADE